MTKEYKEEDWPFNTYFNNTTLPGNALSLDAATMYGHTPEANDIEADWFFRFTVSVGRIRTDDSHNVLVSSRGLLAKLLRYEEEVVAKRIEIEPAEDPYIVFNEWIESLEVMIQEAEKVKACIWVAGYKEDQERLKEVIRRTSPVPRPKYLFPGCHYPFHRVVRRFNG